jgi:hypothetical protein
MSSERDIALAAVTEATKNPQTGEYIIKMLEAMCEGPPPREPELTAWNQAFAVLKEAAGPEAFNFAINSYNRVVTQHYCKCVPKCE